LSLEQNHAPDTVPWLGAGSIVTNGHDMQTVLNYFMFDQPAWFQQYSGSDKHGYYNFCQSKGDDASHMQTGYGWFITSWTPPAWLHPTGDINVVSKDGGVLGFSSWIGMQNETPREYGLFVLSNGPDAQGLGRLFYAMLTGVVGATASADAMEQYLSPTG
jgi:hypothetical protein